MSRRQSDRSASAESGQPCESYWTSSIPQVASEDIIAIGNGRYARFRRDRRFAQVQVTFTAPEGVDPNPGRELTDQFKEQGWMWREKEPGKPWSGYTSSINLRRMIPPLAETAAMRCMSSF